MTLKIMMGTNTFDTRFILDGVDVSKSLKVLSLSIGPVEANQMTVATLKVAATADIEVLPENIRVYSPGGYHSCIESSTGYCVYSVHDTLQDNCLACGLPRERK